MRNHIENTLGVVILFAVLFAFLWLTP